MISDRDAQATIAVKDMAKARKFYGETLGFEEVEPGDDGGAIYRSGDSTIVVYPSEYAGTNRATSATWGVGDELREIVRTLDAAGVEFAHYDDLPGMEREGHVHHADGFEAAWFLDPDGNILHINNQD